MELVERSTVDVGVPGRDAATGLGRIDIVNLVDQTLTPPVPLADQLETNDDAGESAARVALRSRRTIDATIDGYDDPNDVYRVYLRRGVLFTAALNAELGGPSTLVLWRPGTEHVVDITAVAVQSGALLAWRKPASPVLRVRVEQTGWHYLQVKAPPKGGGGYRLFFEATRG